MSKNISHKSKLLYEKWLIQRDGINCFYCKKPIFKMQKHVHDHLNNNRNDNRLENFVRSHYSCNTAKSFNSDFEILASEKLAENESALFFPIEDNLSEEMSSEIKISKNNFDIVEQFISEKIVTDEYVFWNEALYGGVAKCKKKTGYGSVQSVRNYLHVLVYSDKFMKTKDHNKKSIIVRRNGN